MNEPLILTDEHGTHEQPARRLTPERIRELRRKPKPKARGYRLQGLGEAEGVLGLYDYSDDAFQEACEHLLDCGSPGYDFDGFRIYAPDGSILGELIWRRA